MAFGLIGASAVGILFVFVGQIRPASSEFAKGIEVGGFALLLIPCGLTR